MHFSGHQVIGLPMFQDTHVDLGGCGKQPALWSMFAQKVGKSFRQYA
jgi:hypothetical protein